MDVINENELMFFDIKKGNYTIQRINLKTFWQFQINDLRDSVQYGRHFRHESSWKYMQEAIKTDPAITETDQHVSRCHWRYAKWYQTVP